MQTRRTFVTTTASALAVAGLPWPRPLLAAVTGANRAEARRRSLLAALAAEDRDYDSAARMLRKPPGGPGQHTQLKTGVVHPTRQTLLYAAALFDSGEPERIRRGREILPAVIALQDQDPASKTCGVWPWYLEEPLEKMAPPDLNGADFCGVPLLAVWLGHRARLGEPLAGQVRESIRHAARAIERRNVAPDYTNIALMGTYVTLVAAQEFKLADLRAYAKERLRRLHDFIVSQGSLTEYNSPTYTIVALVELAQMLQHVRDARDRQQIAALHELAWKHAATHFHPPTRQWAGPHSRSYETDLRKRRATLAFLEAALGGKADFHLGDPLPLDLDAGRLALECPRKLTRYYTEFAGPRQVVETFAQADPKTPGAKNPVVGTTYLHARYTLGSVNRGDFWKQRRPLLAYWGSAQRCAYLRVRFLHDGEDFASALIFSAQHEGNVLSAVVFATDHGDAHPSLDKLKDATLRAKDLRLRFEFDGDLQDFAVRTLPGPERALVLQDRQGRFVLRPLGGRFGDAEVKWSSPELQVAGPLDAVVYSGEEKSINLAALDEAWLGFALQEWPYDQKSPPPAAIEWRQAEGRVDARWPVAGRTLEFSVATKPAPFDVLNDGFSR